MFVGFMSVVFVSFLQMQEREKVVGAYEDALQKEYEEQAKTPIIVPLQIASGIYSDENNEVALCIGEEACKDFLKEPPNY